VGIKPGTALKSGPLILANERPRLAALLAEVSIAWESLEEHLASTLEFLISGGFKKGWMRPDPISNEIFAAVHTQQRMSIFRSVFNVRISDISLRKQLEEVTTVVNTARKCRNIFVHANWAISDDAGYENKIISVTRNRISDYERAHPYGESQILEAIETITGAVRRVQGFSGAIKDILNDHLGHDFIITVTKPEPES